MTLGLRGLLTAAAGVLALSRCAPAPEREATGRAAAPITGGTNDTTHDDVVGIVRRSSSGTSICTGALILPNLVLTARHCVSPVSSENVACSPYTDRTTGTRVPATTAGAPYAAATFAVTTADVIWNATQFSGVAEVRVPPGTEAGTTLCGHDVALLVLSDTIDDVGLVEPRLDVRPVENEVFTAVGYGATDGMGSGTGRRRYRDGLSVVAVGAITTVGVIAQTESEWRGDTGTCRGDSGSPALDALGQTIGVLSRGPSTCDTPVYQRVDSWAMWLRAEANRAVVALGSGAPSAPAWLDAPVPGSAQFGDACRGETECADGLVCAIVGTARRCTSLDCSVCPNNWVCGELAGTAGCVPDPAAVMVPEPPPDDAAGSDAAVHAADEAGMADAGDPVIVPVSTHGGCAVGREISPRISDRRALAALAALGIARAAARGRRQRRRTDRPA